MATVMESRLGKIHVLETNPRKISEGQFNALVESIERDPEFMMTRGVVVWQVPTQIELAEGEVSPFSKQLGKLVCLGGNMRLNAMKALGMREVKDGWLVEAKDERGNWWPRDKAERFVLVDNAQPGNSGENDYEKLVESFNESVMRASGVDFSEFQEMITAGTIAPMVGTDENGDTETDRVEKDPLMGEKSEELKAFIAEREKTRANLKEVDEAGFYLVLVFEDVKEKSEFISKAKVFGGTVAVDRGPNLVLVFESYSQKAEFLDRSGLRDVVTEDGLPALMFGLFCDGRAFAKRMGIELAESGIHNRDQVLDTQLRDMAMEPVAQKTAEEIETEIFERLKAERRELGMATGERGGRAAEGDDESGAELFSARKRGAAEGKAKAKKRGVAKSRRAPEEDAGDGFYVAE